MAFTEREERHVRDALRLHNRAARLSAEGGPTDMIPMPGDPEGTAVTRVSAVFHLLDEALDHIDTIRVHNDPDHKAKEQPS